MGNSFKKLLVICGPTATGKTKLALQLAKEFNGELVSADSRQVYKGLDIGTGKDKPENEIIWGYDIVDPKKEFSVSEYQKFARLKIKEIWKENKLPLLVGGTGFYIKAVIDGIDTISIPKNEKLRNELSKKSVNELFSELQKLNPGKAESLNASDKNNPARLIRAIEVSLSKQNLKDTKLEADILFIGLMHNKKIFNATIENRVKKRLEEGFEKEVDKLLSNGLNSSFQSMNTLGYKQWLEYKNGSKTRKEAIEEWTKEEQKYAGRQMTWFKKQENVNWFENLDPKLLNKVEDLVERWHNTP